MINNSIINILTELNRESDKTTVNLVRRDVLSSKIYLERDLVLAIQGVRRCGKSTLMRQIATEQKIEEQSFFINLEDPRLSGFLNPTLLDGILEFQRHHLKIKHGYIFLDEIQNVNDWEKWTHIQLEKKQQHIIISGSNAALLGGKLGSALTGRHLSVELFPFSYHEARILDPKKDLETHLSASGFPRALTFPEPAKLLREYFIDIIERDVRHHVAARSSQTLMQVAKAVFESTGSETSLRSLAKPFDLSPDTVAQYINAFIDAYLIIPCPFFTYSERKSVARPQKFYPIDLGLHDAIITQSSLNLGKKFETIVFHELRKKHRRVFYWRGKGEVDFVIEAKNGIQPIQVSWGAPKPRHEEALKEFKNEHPHALAPIFINQMNFMNVLSAL